MKKAGPSLAKKAGLSTSQPPAIFHLAMDDVRTYGVTSADVA